MVAPPRPADEPSRLAALHELLLLDTEPEAATDHLVALARSISGRETALISLIDENRQWFKARVGLEACETGRDVSFCGWAILQPEAPLDIPDTHRDARFRDNPLVTGPPRIRSYTGFPLVTPRGHAIGTLCVFD
ncbi:MAG: GAF domain-containing protein, partial [Pseudomonadales bacterium]|nr:GAF domain-containing protein [Pseudomonadales bacterium]